MRVLFVRPDFDDSTHWASAWLAPLVDEARSLGHVVFDLYGPRATPKNVLSYLEGYFPDLAVLVGHGRPDLYTCQNRAPAIAVCRGGEALAGRVACFISCSVAQELGYDIVEKGARAFIGFLKPLIFAYDPSKRANPLADGRARPFMEPIQALVRALLEGESPWGAREEAIRKYDEWIERISRSDLPDAPDLLMYLRHDRDSLIVLPSGRAAREADLGPGLFIAAATSILLALVAP